MPASKSELDRRAAHALDRAAVLALLVTLAVAAAGLIVGVLTREPRGAGQSWATIAILFATGALGSELRASIERRAVRRRHRRHPTPLA